MYIILNAAIELLNVLCVLHLYRPDMLWLGGANAATADDELAYWRNPVFNDPLSCNPQRTLRV